MDESLSEENFSRNAARLNGPPRTCKVNLGPYGAGSFIGQNHLLTTNRTILRNTPLLLPPMMAISAKHGAIAFQTEASFSLSKVYGETE